MRQMLAVLPFALTLSALAQSAPRAEPIKLVMPQGTGSITFQITEAWRPKLIDLLDNGARPVVQLENASTGLDLSYALFLNNSGKPTAESCRNEVVPQILENLASNATVVNVRQSSRKLRNGATLAVASYNIAKVGTIELNQQNVFGFLGNAHTCAEIHLSHVRYRPADQPLFDAALDRFDFDPSFVPTSFNYAGLASIFYSITQNYPAAAVYYRRALDTASTLVSVPTNGDPLAYSRFLTDQLSMSYGLSGDLKRSRAVNEAAIAKDPLYPMYYYNLACADAEEGNAAAARTHLEQAYARRANTIKGEAMPDASKDSSLLKLKDDPAFWNFVQSLPKN